MSLFDRFTRKRARPDTYSASSAPALAPVALVRDGVPAQQSEENREYLAALRAVIDPELGINIVDLGLVYAVAPNDDGGADVVLTMTTPACPLSAVIEADVRDALYDLVEDPTQIRVAIVFEPVWSPRMMSERARLLLGRPR